MAFQPVPNTALFELVHQAGGGQHVQCGIYVRNTALGWPEARLSATGTTIGNGWRDQVMPLMNSSMIFDRVEARDLGAEFGAQAIVEYNTAGTRVGTRASNALAAWVKFTGSGGSAPRDGGIFVPGLVEEDIDADDLALAYRNSLNTALAAINTSIEGGGDAWVIVSRYNKATVPTPPHRRVTAVTNTIASRTTRPRVATQRDRRLGEGA